MAELNRRSRRSKEVECMGLDRDLGYDDVLSDDEYLILGALRGCDDR
jgi:hypothetical protein